MDFETWMAKLDALTQRRLGLSIHELPDMCFSDWFEDEITPGQACRLVMEESGF